MISVVCVVEDMQCCVQNNAIQRHGVQWSFPVLMNGIHPSVAHANPKVGGSISGPGSEVQMSSGETLNSAPSASTGVWLCLWEKNRCLTKKKEEKKTCLVTKRMLYECMNKYESFRTFLSFLREKHNINTVPVCHVEKLETDYKYKNMKIKRS